MTMTEQNLGNYIRLVKQSKELQWELNIYKKMVEIMAKTTAFDDTLDITPIINFYKQQAIYELVSEQNKKAADNASI